MQYIVSDLSLKDLVNLDLGLEALEIQYQSMIDGGPRPPRVSIFDVIDSLKLIRETREKLSKWDYKI